MLQEINIFVKLRTRSRPESVVTDRPPACTKNYLAFVFNLNSFNYRFILCWFHYNSGITNKSTNAQWTGAVPMFRDLFCAL
jgi:hypothetical protein